MCLEGKKYFINLHSSQGTPMHQDGNLHKRYDLNWNNWLRTIPHDTEYFKIKVEQFSLYAPLGMRQGALSIHIPQFNNLYVVDSLVKTPLAFAHGQDYVDCDISADESFAYIAYRVKSSDTEGAICTIERDAFLEVVLTDELNKQDTIQYQTFDDPPEERPVPNYLMQISLEPYSQRK